jgi:hypothetical protein
MPTDEEIVAADALVEKVSGSASGSIAWHVLRWYD